MILTDTEILALEKTTPAMNDAGEEWIYFARAVEAAVIRKLAAGVSVEPVEIAIGEYWDCAYQEGHLNRPDGDSANKLLHEIRCSVQTAVAAARVQAIEEVVALCDPDELGLEQGDDCATGVYRVEKAIHALIGKEAT